MTGTSSRANGLSQAWMEGQRTTLTKWVLIILLNMVAFVLAWLANGRPTPDLAQWPFSFYLGLFPGALQPIGRVILTLAGALLNLSILQYLLVANLAGAIPFFFGAAFIKKLYGMDSFIIALDYLIDSLFEPSFYRSDIQRDEGSPAGYGKISTSRRVALVVNGKLVPAGQRPANRTIAWAGGPGKVIIPPDYAAQLQRGGRLTRVAGPGVARLHRFEKVYNLVTLRHLVRSSKITALTRDGIPVSVELSVHACARGSAVPPSNSSSPPHYPLDPQAIVQITLNTVHSETRPEDRGDRWGDSAIMTAVDVFNNVLAKYSVDEIFEALGSESDPRMEIQGQVREQTTHLLQKSGIEITELWLGQFDLPADVTAQYVEFWQADWKRKDQAALAKGQAATIRELGRARAQAQKTIIEALVASFQAAQEAVPDIPPKQLLALRFIDSLEQLNRQVISPANDTELQQQNLALLRSAIRGQGPEAKEA
jgi:regulator of protease activity HflC (stomatin/prohibitin superfamily)